MGPVDTQWLIYLVVAAAWTTALTFVKVPSIRLLRFAGWLACYILGAMMLFRLPFWSAVATWLVPGLAAAVIGLAFELLLVWKGRALGGGFRPRLATVFFGLLLWPGRLPRAVSWWVSKDEPLSAEAERYLAEAAEEFRVKQEALEREWRIGGGGQWGFDQSTGILKFVFGDGAELQADGQVLASYKPADRSWEWAWNNPHVEQGVARDSHQVKTVGEQLGIGYLQAGMIPAPNDGAIAYLCGIGVKATGSVGVYRGGTGDLDILILVKNLRWVKQSV